MTFMRPALVLTLLPALLLTAPGRAQDPSFTPPKSALSVDVKLVVLPAVVRDKKGALVAGLTRDNFALQVDGKAQALRYFDHDTDVPLTLGLLIDTSGSVRNQLDEERAASAAFLDKMLIAQRDKAFLIQFARTVELLQDVTDSRGKLQAALKEVDSEKPEFGRGGSNDPNNSDPQQDNGDRRQGRGGRGQGGGAGGGTALYDAVFLASEDVLAKQPRGRRALVLLTDGEDRGSKETLAKAIESAQRADAIVYAIYYKGEEHGGGRGFGGGGGGPFGGGGRGGGRGGGGYPGGGGGQGGRGGGRESQVDGKKVLERVCGETGGRMFEVTKKETVEKIYGEIGEELRSQYRIGFTPTADAASEGYHQVTVSLTGAAVDKKTVVQTRDGYYTQ